MSNLASASTPLLSLTSATRGVNKKTLLSLTIAALFNSTILNTSAVAAETDELNDAVAEQQAMPNAVLDTIVIRAARDELEQAAGLSVISEEAIEKASISNDIAEIVRKMPGVNLSGSSTSGQRGNQRQIDLRGMGPNNTLILIDGRPVTSHNAVRPGRASEQDTRGDSQWVPPSAIERIEVLRGPAAVTGLTLTGDVIHTGARYADMANTLKVDGYTTLDLGARYKTKFADQDVTLKGVVTNVTGEDYWQSVGGLAGYGYLNAGEPTAVKVSATFDF